MKPKTKTQEEQKPDAIQKMQISGDLNEHLTPGVDEAIKKVAKTADR